MESIPSACRQYSTTSVIFGELGGTPEKTIRKRKWNPLNVLTSKHRSINKLPNTHFEGSTPAAFDMSQRIG
jgi:hypothetical protein